MGNLTRHVIVEFAGMPKSGKTTVLDTVAHYLRRNEVPIAEYHGGGRYAPVGKSDLGALNLYLACVAVKHCLGVAQDGLAPRVHLLDRGVVDRLVFTQALYSLGWVSPEHRTSMEGLLGSPELRNCVDLCFVFSTSCGLSLEREQKNKLTLREGRIMNGALLDHLRIASRDVGEGRVQAGCAARVIHVNTDIYNERVVDTARTVIDELGALLARHGMEVPFPEEQATQELAA